VRGRRAGETFVIEDVLRRESRRGHPGSGAYFWRTAAGAEGPTWCWTARRARRIVVEVKTAYGGFGPPACGSCARPCGDIGASRAWIVDQGRGH